jgi:hypothetical protein
MISMALFSVKIRYLSQHVDGDEGDAAVCVAPAAQVEGE